MQATDEDKKRLTKLDSFFQLFCMAQGLSFFLAPAYMKNAGIVPGVVFGILSTLFYLYVARVYFWCEDRLREHDPTCANVTTINGLVREVLVKIAKWPEAAWYMNAYLKLAVICCWAFGLAFHIFFITKNFQLILQNFCGYRTNDLQVMLYTMVPLVCFAFTPNLEALKTTFCLSCLSILLIMAETFYYIFTTDRYPPPQRINFYGSVTAIPTYINNFLMTIAVPPLLFMYKNEMRSERDLTSLCGSLNMSCLAATVLVIVYAIACTIRLGDHVAENIMSNLPNNAVVNASNLIMTVNLLLTEPIGFYGFFIYVWEGALQKRIENSGAAPAHVKTFQYVLKIGLIAITAAIALLLPCFSTLIDVSGSFCVFNDVVTLPFLLETVIVWKGAGSYRRKCAFLLKNCSIVALSTAYCAWSLAESMVEFHRE